MDGRFGREPDRVMTASSDSGLARRVIAETRCARRDAGSDLVTQRVTLGEAADDEGLVVERRDRRGHGVFRKDSDVAGASAKVTAGEAFALLTGNVVGDP